MSPAASSVADALRAAMNAARKAQDKDRTLVLGRWTDLIDFKP